MLIMGSFRSLLAQPLQQGLLTGFYYLRNYRRQLAPLLKSRLSVFAVSRVFPNCFTCFCKVILQLQENHKTTEREGWMEAAAEDYKILKNILPGTDMN